MGEVVFIDTETTGLDLQRHEIWELALVAETGSVLGERGFGSATASFDRVVMQFPVRIARADPTALRISRFHERTWDAQEYVHYKIGDHESIASMSPEVAASMIARLTAGKHLCGAVPNFDAERLDRWLRNNGQVGTWHYHLIDVEALMVGYLSGADTRGEVTRLPWVSRDLAEAIGVKQDEETMHTALGDALWARDIYEAIR